MPGIPGKGGVKGRSGRKASTGETMPKYTVALPAEVRAQVVARGPDWVRTALAAALEG